MALVWLCLGVGMITVNHGWLSLVGLGQVRLDHIWVEVARLSYVWLVEPGGWAKLVLVEFWIGLGWVRLSLGEMVRFGHIGIK